MCLVLPGRFVSFGASTEAIGRSNDVSIVKQLYVLSEVGTEDINDILLRVTWPAVVLLSS